MTAPVDPSSLFRQEALDFHTGDHGAGGALRLGAPWLRPLCWLVVALVPAGLLAAASFPVERRVSGPARVEPDATFVALFPAATAGSVSAGARLRLDRPAGSGPPGAGRVTAVETVGADEAVRAGFTPDGDAALLVRGVLDPSARPAGAARAGRARAEVSLGSERLLEILLG